MAGISRIARLAVLPLVAVGLGGWLLTAPAAPPVESSAVKPGTSEFADAGVCARCHVNVVLEWGISVHRAERKSCRDCHGRSEKHVANERNEIKPDRIPRGEAVAGLCARCHEEGCPETDKTTSCQDCHHVHALVDPRRAGKKIRDEQTAQFDALLKALENYRQTMVAGEALLRAERWREAERLFAKASQLRPGDATARQRLTAVARRRNPNLPGFRIIGEDFSPDSGLPFEVVVEPIGLKMRLIPGGAFDMGDDEFTDARPVHTVDVMPFYMGTVEVTVGQWEELMGDRSATSQEDARRPVRGISWHDAYRFITTLNARTPGGGFRLPTEAEWEYACRAGSTSAEEDPATLHLRAWYRTNSRVDPTTDKAPLDIDDYAPHPVGTRAANRWGLHDMQGNVWEWCSSLHHPYVYRADDGRESPAEGLRVLRGGGYADSAEFLRPTLRYADRPDHAFRWVGMRLARTVPTLE